MDEDFRPVDPMMSQDSGQPQSRHDGDLEQTNKPEPYPELQNEGRFKASFEQIIGGQLSPENIDSYADDALDKLVTLVDAVLEDYLNQTQSSLTGKALEDTALKHYGLVDMTETLDNISAKATEIKYIDGLVGKITNIDRVIVPPEPTASPSVENAGTFKEKSIIARTKTILFILANDFGVDLEDSEQLFIETGIVNDNMMRKLSYTMIDAPTLMRTILCCDEEGNVTYIFDSSQLAANNIENNDLIKLSKPEINNLLQNHPEIGQRVVYSNKFVSKMVRLIQDIQPETRDDNETASAQYLYPKAPEGILSVKGLERKLKVASGVVSRAIERLGQAIGETKLYRFQAKTTIGYTQEQQALIEKYLEERGLFGDEPPKGVLSASGLADKLGVVNATVQKAIAGLGDDLGETRIYKFYSANTTGYTPEQQEMIRQYLEAGGLFSEEAPEGILSARGIARKYEISEITVKEAIKRLGKMLETTKTYRFGNYQVIGYSPEQQEMIRQYLEAGGLFSEEAPEGILSTWGIAKKLKVTHQLITKAIKSLGETLGEVNKYKFGSTVVPGYTPEQQEMIRQYLEAGGLFSEEAPEGILSISGIVKKLKNISHESVAKAIENIGETLGEVNKYKFGGMVVLGYTPEQQEQIANYLKSRGYIR